MTKQELEVALQAAVAAWNSDKPGLTLQGELEARGLRIVPAEPVAWGQLGMLNGRTYLRENYERTPYPPPADVARNLNLVPLYAAPLCAGGAGRGSLVR